MKKIKKDVLDKCIELTRQYWGNEFTDALLLRERNAVGALSGCDWYGLSQFLDGVLSSLGFNPEASNWDIYLILRVLGWEVVDEVEKSESL